MMDWTDRHCRYFHRRLTRQARLYTEMVVADAVIHGDRERLLGFSAEEHPLAVQLGGSEPAKLAEAARTETAALTNYRKALADYARASGTLLEQRHIEFAGDGSPTSAAPATGGSR